MAVTADQFKRSAIIVRTKVKSTDNQLYSVWLVPPKFSCNCFMNDPLNLPAKIEVSLAQAKQSTNVLFHDRATSRSEFSRYSATTITATQNVEAGEELLVDYGSIYEFLPRLWDVLRRMRM